MKTPHKRTVLAIDDDEINLMILSKCAQEAGYQVHAYESATAGWEYLRSHPHEVDIVLLDKMMPDMNGMEMLRRIKLDKDMQHVPVILQTGDVGITQMREGLESGAYYYLTKPFHPEILTAVLNSAAQECDLRENLRAQADSGQAQLIHILHAGLFQIKTHTQASMIASAISQQALYPEFVAVGLMELLSNAIEHGSLGFGAEEKQKLLTTGDWADAMQKRATQAPYADRCVQLEFQRNVSGIEVIIRDQGEGFNWQKYIYSEMTPGITAGRGISKAVIMLDEVQFRGSGNEVRCQIATATALN